MLTILKVENKRVRLFFIFVLVVSSLFPAQVRMEESFPVNTINHDITLSVPSLSRNMVIERLREVRNSKEFKEKNWKDESFYFTSFEKAESSMSVKKIHNLEDKGYNLSYYLQMNYDDNGDIHVQITNDDFKKWLDPDGKPAAPENIKYLEFYQTCSKELLELVTHYLTGNITSDENNNALLEEAEEYTEEENYDKALKTYTTILSSDPSNSLALFNTSQLLFSLKKYPEALHAIEKLEKNTDLPASLILNSKDLKIQILLTSGQHEKAFSEGHILTQYAEKLNPETAFKNREDAQGKLRLIPVDEALMLLKSAHYFKELHKDKESLDALKKYESLIPDKDKNLLKSLFRFYCILHFPQESERIRQTILKGYPKEKVSCKN
ncbi:hypothetical protein IW15_03280 [Chryseobacterium soli]|uniref:Uncharacterized protein n=1 Tax=Chryseobacterium soli TaxID=445961 RepID=A0A086ACQ3_9FLAO|nr:hypothetical protein [Chryseobacterium soli]KFF14467.1 hypothetical protein IW15_03280 [Chryseobacterium soli]